MKKKRYTSNSLKEAKGNKDYNKLFLNFLDEVEFELVKCDETNRKATSSWDDEKNEGDWALIDLQGGNLGDIEADRFNDASDIIDRLNTYINDYYLNDEEWGEYDSIEDALKDNPDHPCYEILDMIYNHIDEVNLNKVYEMQGGNHSEVGTAIYVVMYIKNNDNPQPMYQRGKEIALHCSEQLAQKYVDTLNKYSSVKDVKFTLRRESYAPSGQYNVWEKDQIEDEIADETSRGDAYAWEDRVRENQSKIIEWLYEHEQATQDALAFFKKERLEDIDIYDLVDWIDYHKNLSNDFKNKFGFSTEIYNENLNVKIKEASNGKNFRKSWSINGATYTQTYHITKDEYKKVLDKLEQEKPEAFMGDNVYGTYEYMKKNLTDLEGARKNVIFSNLKTARYIANTLGLDNFKANRNVRFIID